MVEAMYERSPSYIKQFKKQFKSQIVEGKPTSSNTNVYAVCAHFDSEFCNLVTNHYHVLIDTATFEKEPLKRNQTFPVPCIFTALISYFQLQQIWRLMETFLQRSNWRLNSTSPQKRLTLTKRKQLSAFAYTKLKDSYAKQVNVKTKTVCKDGSSWPKDDLQRPSSIKTSSN